MTKVTTSLYCFTCKTRTDTDVEIDDVKKTKNNRYYISVLCETCGRKMTALIKSNLIKANDGHSESDHHPGGQKD